MLNQPKVSIVIPFYNSNRYVDEILTSVLGQTFNAIEVICVDDGSTDDTLSLLKAFEERDSRIHVISQEHRGAGTARNRGIIETVGKYIMFLDSDDLCQETFVEEMYYAAESNDADVIICFICVEDSKTKQIMHKRGFDPAWLKPNCKTRPKEVNNLFYTVGPHSYNKIYRRELIMKQGIQFSKLLAYNDHLFTYAALVSAKNIVAIDRELYTYRIHNNPDSISTNRVKHVVDFLYAEKELYDWLKSRGYLDRYLETYLYLWRSRLRGACMIVNDTAFIDAVVETLMNEEPWQSMSDRTLQREAGLQTATAKLKLMYIKMELWKNKGEHSVSSGIMIRQSENENNNMEKIIRELTMRGKKIRGSTGWICTAIWMLQERGIHGLIAAAQRMHLK